MRNPLWCAILGGLMVLAPLSVRLALAGQSGSVQPSKSAPGDLSGIWLIHPPANAKAFSSFAFSKEEPPLTGWGETQYKAAKPVLRPSQRPPKESNDPVYRCLPPGLPRVYLHPKPIEIVQLPDEIIMMFEYNRLVRHIYIDGRPHDEFLDPPLWMGDSIGKWEGDTLVIDTIGFNDKTWLDRVGHPHSDMLHVVERMRRTAKDTLEDQIIIEDPKAYRKPWTVQTSFTRRPDLTLDWEDVCEDQKLAERQ